MTRWRPSVLISLAAATVARLLTIALILTPTASRGAASERDVKAAYLFKIASFVQWPGSAFADPGSPLRICVAGRDDLYNLLTIVVRNQQASGRRLLAEHIDGTRPVAATRCHILFIGRGDNAARTLLAEVGGRPVLTITDREGGSHGGDIEFVMVGGNVRFTIHRQSAQARQLELSSKLLAAATSVEP